MQMLNVNVVSLFDLLGSVHKQPFQAMLHACSNHNLNFLLETSSIHTTLELFTDGMSGKMKAGTLVAADRLGSGSIFISHL
jgi:hypothetical protein